MTAARLALVTGSARRLGRDIALALARAGWDVAVHYGQSESDALRTVADIEALGRRCQAFAAHLDEPAEAEALFDRVVAAMGRPACLVNNAARFEFDAPGGFTAQALSRHAGPNLAAPILLTQRLYHALGESDRACVINLLDQKLSHPNPDFFSYTLTKAALAAATQMMAMAFAPRLRVNAVSPGATLPSWRQDRWQFDAAHRIALLDRSSEPTDIAQAVVYLADAPAVTGVDLVVDGGQHLMSLSRDVMFLTPDPVNPTR